MQEGDGLVDRLAMAGQSGVTGLDRDVVGHVGKLRACDRNASVIRPWQDEARSDRRNGAAARDDADGVIGRRQRGEHGRRRGRKLLAGGAEDGAIDRKIGQQIGDLAAAIRRAQHDDAAELRGAMGRDVEARQQAAHGMSDEMDRAVALGGEGGDRRMDVLDQRLQRLACGWHSRGSRSHSRRGAAPAPAASGSRHRRRCHGAAPRRPAHRAKRRRCGERYATSRSAAGGTSSRASAAAAT